MTIPSSVRLGLIGAGYRGRAIIKAIEHTKSAHLVCVGSRGSETRAYVPSSCKIFPDWRVMLDPAALDGLIVATPPATHFSISCDVLSEKIPLLIETPLTTTLEDAIALKKISSPPLIMVNHTLLAHPAYRFIKELVIGNTVGPIRALRSYIGMCSPDRSVLWHFGAQELALCIDLLNTSEPEDLSARYIRRQKTPSGYTETIELQFNFVPETDVLIRLSNSLEKAIHYLAIHFDRLTLIYDGADSGQLSLHPPVPDFSVPNDQGQKILLKKEDLLVNTITEFTMAIANRLEDSESFNLGVDVVALLARCQATLEGYSFSESL